MDLEKKILFAPMEGVTNSLYRGVLAQIYPEWDYYACDFLRIPSRGAYPQKHILKHFGKDLYESNIRDKTIYQVLTSPGAYTKQACQSISSLGFKWLDLNLGCPSKTVVKRQGGSFLLSKPEELKKVISEVRESFPRFFSVKIRVGFEDDSLFESNLRMFEELGVDAITIHGRTRVELYKGRANWDYFKRAKSIVKIPILGNGDIWSTEDIERCYKETGVNSVMIARGALKTPWLAKDYYSEQKPKPDDLKRQIHFYYHSLLTVYQEKISQEKTLSFFKSLSRYIFDDLVNGKSLKSQVLRSQSLAQFMRILDTNLSN